VAGVVVDTSVWIAFFAGGAAEDVEDALQNGAAIVPPIVVAELISGARTAEQRAAIGELLHQHLAEGSGVHETGSTPYQRAPRCYSGGTSN
jgi:predicted nucleic acid-binding protein